MAKDRLDEFERSGSEFQQRVYIARWMYSNTDKVWSQMELVVPLISKLHKAYQLIGKFHNIRSTSRDAMRTFVR